MSSSSLRHELCISPTISISPPYRSWHAFIVRYIHFRQRRVSFSRTSEWQRLWVISGKPISSANVWSLFLRRTSFTTILHQNGQDWRATSRWSIFFVEFSDKPLHIPSQVWYSGSSEIFRWKLIFRQHTQTPAMFILDQKFGDIFQIPTYFISYFIFVVFASYTFYLVLSCFYKLDFYISCHILFVFPYT